MQEGAYADEPEPVIAIFEGQNDGARARRARERTGCVNCLRWEMRGSSSSVRTASGNLEAHFLNEHC